MNLDHAGKAHDTNEICSQPARRLQTWYIAHERRYPVTAHRHDFCPTFLAAKRHEIHAPPGSVTSFRNESNNPTSLASGIAIAKTR
jgi:hypothetical protein